MCSKICQVRPSVHDLADFADIATRYCDLQPSKVFQAREDVAKRIGCMHARLRRKMTLMTRSDSQVVVTKMWMCTRGATSNAPENAQIGRAYLHCSILCQRATECRSAAGCTYRSNSACDVNRYRPTKEAESAPGNLIRLLYNVSKTYLQHACVAFGDRMRRSARD